MIFGVILIAGQSCKLSCMMNVGHVAPRESKFVITYIVIVGLVCRWQCKTNRQVDHCLSIGNYSGCGPPAATLDTVFDQPPKGISRKKLVGYIRK